MEDIVKVLKKKNNRGPDGMAASHFSSTFHNLCHWIHEVSDGLPLPPHELDILVSFIPKSTGTPTYTNLRPIAIGNIKAKVASCALNARLTPTLARICGHTQFGFIPNASPLVPLSIINARIKEGWGVVFIDFERAFTNVHPQLILTLLKYISAPPSMVRWVEHLLAPHRAFFLSEGKVSQKYFKVGRGVRQGDPSSPILFNLVVSLIPYIIKDGLPSAEVYQFADDTVILLPPSLLQSHSPTDIINAILRIETLLQLPINKLKTKTINFPNPLWESVSEFKYLGIIIPLTDTNRGGLSLKLEALKWVPIRLRHLQVTSDVRSFFFNTYVISRITYLCSFVPPTEQEIRKLEWLQRECLGQVSITGTHKHYLGRSLRALANPPAKGGLSARHIRTHITALATQWLKIRKGFYNVPPQYITSLNAEADLRTASIPPAHITLCVNDGGVPECALLYTQTLLSSLTPPTPTEVLWEHAHPLISSLAPHFRDVLFLSFFSVLNCAEFRARHVAAAVLKRCKWCPRQTLAGPTHVFVEQCVGFWRVCPHPNPWLVPPPQPFNHTFTHWCSTATSISLKSIAQPLLYLQKHIHPKHKRGQTVDVGHTHLVAARLLSGARHYISSLPPSHKALRLAQRTQLLLTRATEQARDRALIEADNSTRVLGRARIIAVPSPIPIHRQAHNLAPGVPPAPKRTPIRTHSSSPPTKKTYHTHNRDFPYKNTFRRYYVHQQAHSQYVSYYKCEQTPHVPPKPPPKPNFECE